jgi:hypothetical protein
MLEALGPIPFRYYPFLLPTDYRRLELLHRVTNPWIAPYQCRQVRINLIDLRTEAY